MSIIYVNRRRLRRSAYTVFFYVASLIGTSHVMATHAHASEELTHGVGFSVGYIVGTGITYAHYFGSHILQGSYIGDVSRYKTDYKFGLSYARYIHRVDDPRSLLPVALKLVAGMDIHYQNGNVDRDIIVPSNYYNTQQGKMYFYHTGAGLGIDIGTIGKPGILFSVVLTYALNSEIVNGKREWEVSPLPAAGLLYSW